MPILTPSRYALLRLIAKAGSNLKAESLALGRNHAYLQQYIHKGTPQKLPEDVRDALGRRFGVSPNIFREDTDPNWEPPDPALLPGTGHAHDAGAAASAGRPRFATPHTPLAPPLGYAPFHPATRPFTPVDISAADMSPKRASAPDRNQDRDQDAPSRDGQFRIPEYNVAPQAGPGAMPAHIATEDGPQPTDHWSLPRRFLSAHTDNPEALVVLRVAGDSMEPDYQAGERVLVDTAHRTPSPPGVYVLWDGFGLVLKRLEIEYGSDDPVTVRIMSINPAYPTYTRSLDEVHINGRVVGKWVWK